MIFSSVIFLFVFLVITLGVYYLIPRSWRNGFLAFVSLFFYAWGEPSYVVVMLISIVLNWIAGILVDKSRAQNIKKLILGIFCVLDIGILVFFKYAAFIFENITQLIFKISPDFQGFPFEGFLSGIALPIGISFYTFQMMSYVIDVYRKETPVQKNIVSFACYVSLFPQLIAGPIVQYKTIAEQLQNRRETVEKFAEGVIRFLVGLAKKLILADTAGALWNTVAVTDFSTLPAATAIIGAVAFSFQIYFDFSGYSDMALGLGKMLDFEFLENFNYPYISKSVTEFWRRWHISLSSWFRDYVYIPLGGNRRGFAKQIRNIVIVWLLTGIWHGASWNFLLWGAWFGLLLIFEKLVFLKVLDKLPSFFGHLWALLCALFGWVIFANERLPSLWAYVKAMFGAGGSFADGETLWLLSNNAVLFAVCAVASTPLFKNLWKKIENCKAAPLLRVGFTACLFTLCIAYVVSSTFNFFIYFRF